MHTEAARRPSQRTSATRRRLRVLFFFLFCFMLWAGLTLWDQVGAVRDNNIELSKLEEKLDAEKAKNEALKHQLIRLQDPEYIEQLLQSELHMTKEGEILFIETE